MPAPRLAAAAATAAGALALVATGNYTILRDTRCHDDVGQVHGVAAFADCEAACVALADAPLFTFCPPTGAEGCAPGGGPPPGTCWCFPLAALATCEASANWTSGYAAQPPPPPPPPDWAPRIASGDMKFTADPPEAIGEGYYPVVANGFVGFEVGPFTQPFVNTWPWRDAGSLKLSGVYSGFNWTSPSHRAQIPKVSDVIIPRQPGVTYTSVGAAVDFGEGVYLNRTLVVSGAAGCADGTVVEQRSYAHRGLRELFVFELRAFSNTSDPGWAGCTLPVVWRIAPDVGLGDTALAAQPAPGAPGAVAWVGTTTAPEQPGLPLRQLAVVLDAWAAAGPSQLTFTPASPVVSVRAVLRSDLDVPGAATPADVAAAAASTWAAYAAQSPAQLLASHTTAMRELWARGGVELGGNASFAAVVNASLYDIVSSLRADWNWSTSPGGLATGAYGSHVFWG